MLAMIERIDELPPTAGLSKIAGSFIEHGGQAVPFVFLLLQHAVDVLALFRLFGVDSADLAVACIEFDLLAATRAGRNEYVFGHDEVPIPLNRRGVGQVIL